MYQCGQKILYGIHGVCLINDIETKAVNRQKIEYYVLEPIQQPGTRYYVPVHNENAVAKLCPILSVDELNELLKTDVSGSDTWIPNENERRNHYKKLINGTDRYALLEMVYAVYQHKMEQAVVGRKFHQCDENFLRDAKKLLGSEFSVVLDMDIKDVASYVEHALMVK